MLDNYQNEKLSHLLPVQLLGKLFSKEFSAFFSFIYLLFFLLQYRYYKVNAQLEFIKIVSNLNLNCYRKKAT